MNTIGLVLFIIFAIASVGLLAFNVYSSIKANKDNKLISVDYKVVAKKSVILSAAFAGVFTAMLISIHIWLKHTPSVNEWIATCLGGLVLGFSLDLGANFFILHYYGKPADKKIDKTLFIALIIAAPVFLLSFFYMLDGFAGYLTYPLINSLNFKEGFLRPNDNGSGIGITLYALCIVSGALFVYILCDHKFYQQYGKHGILESTFFVAFPAGIIGARIFYVFGQWNTFFPFSDSKPWYAPFEMWNGGLTILGGAICGIVAGCLWFKFVVKKYSLRLAMDIIVPTILIAQAIGRWGNFFNTEVHGVLSNEEYWMWLPRIIYENIHYGLGNGVLASAGKVYVPLFFIEGITNMLGYFVLAHLFGNKLRKYTALGDLAYGYVIWYGMTRVILEPMRNPKFIMDNLWSWLWALVFVFAGAVAIVGNHVIEYLKSKKKGELKVKNSWKKDSIIQIAIVGVLSIASIVAGAVIMANAPVHEFITPTNLDGVDFLQYNFGFIFVVSGVSLLIGATMPIIHLVEILKNKETVSE